MTIYIFGYGNIGMAIAYALERLNYRFIVIDRNINKLRYASKQGCETCKLDLCKDSLPNIRIGITSLPGDVAYNIIIKLLKKGTNLIDTSYYSKDVWTLDKYTNNVIYIPDTGLAPGLSNILVGRCYSTMYSLDTIHIYVGGISIKPDDILGLALTWSVSDLIDEYIRPARYLKDYKIRKTDPFNITGTIYLPDIGRLEYFITDGLRTMLKTFYGKIRNMYEFTLRYPGHIEKMRFLKRIRIIPDLKRELSKLLDEAISNKFMDRVILYIEAISKDKKVNLKLDKKYNKRRKISAMAQTTGFTAAVVSTLVYDEIITAKGIYPPENIGLDEDIYNLFIKRINKLYIKLNVKEKCS